MPRRRQLLILSQDLSLGVLALKITALTLGFSELTSVYRGVLSEVLAGGI